MEENRLLNTGTIPLLISGSTGKHYFELDESGHLKYYLNLNKEGDNKEKDSCWACISENIIQRKINGFDATVDKLGNTHLLGYDREGSILYLCLSPDGTENLSPCHVGNLIPCPVSSCPDAASLIKKEEGRQISHLACCTDNENRLHLLYLAINSEKEMWWLFYLRQEGGQWLEKVVLDFGYFQLEQCGIIFSDPLDNLFLLHRLHEEKGYSLVLRSFKKESNLPEQTFYLGEKQFNCFFPDALITPDNSLHISWISRKNNIMFINYARRSPRGKWGNNLCTEISQGSALLAPLFLIKDVLFLTWQNNKMLFCLVSRDGGDSWKWGTKIELEETSRMIRFRRELCALNDPPWWGNYTFSPASPPETYMQPEVTLEVPLESQPEEGSVSGELEILDLLTSRLLTGYDNLQASNTFLKQKIDHQKIELADLYSINLAKTKTLQEKLTSKNIEITKMKKIFQNSIGELKVKISREREDLLSKNEELQQQIGELQQQIKALRAEIEKREKNNLLLTRELAKFKEEINLIKKENEYLQKKSITYYLKKLMKKNRD